MLADQLGIISISHGALLPPRERWEQDRAHRMLGAVVEGGPSGFRRTERERERGRKKETPRLNHWLINFPQKAAGRLAGSLCAKWFIDFL